jgi:amino acid permease
MHKINVLKTNKASEPCEVNQLHPSAHAELAKSAPPRKASWITVGLLIWGEIVGAGLLGLPKAFGDLGWVLSALSLIFWLIINLKVGTMMAEIVSYYPKSIAFGDTAHHTFGIKAGQAATFIRNFYLTFTLGDYVLISSKALTMLFYDAQVCFVIWTVIVIVILLPLLQIRVLNGMRYLMWVNLTTIFVAVFIALGTLSSMGTSQTLEIASLQSSNNACSNCSQTEIIASNLSLKTFFEAQSLIAFAYVGVLIYVELMAELEKPDQFDKALLGLSGPLQLFTYSLSGFWGYALLGSQAPGLFIEAVPVGPEFRAIGFFLAVHLMFTYLITGTVISRSLHRLVFPCTINDWGFKGRKDYAFCSMFLLLVTWLIANLIPFFSSLTGLLGAFFLPVIAFGLPFAMLFKARHDARVKSSIWLLTFIVLVMIFQILLFGFGSYAAIANIIDEWATSGKPFECKGRS